MNPPFLPHRRHTLLALLAVALAGCATPPYSSPQADATPTAKALRKLPVRNERVAVAVLEVRSNVPAVDTRAALDMFKTALVQTQQFRVFERQRLDEGVGRERQLLAQGTTSGSAAPRQLTGAEYVFEVALSETNTSETQRSDGIVVAGAQLGGGGNRDSLAMGVRLVAVGTGEIVDAVRVVKPLQAQSMQASGLGNLLAAVRRRQGKDTTFTPDINFQQEPREGLSGALRAAIDEAALQLARRFQP